MLAIGVVGARPCQMQFPLSPSLSPPPPIVFGLQNFVMWEKNPPYLGLLFPCQSRSIVPLPISQNFTLTIAAATSSKKIIVPRRPKMLVVRSTEQTARVRHGAPARDPAAS
jgi:hypothetical protein